MTAPAESVVLALNSGSSSLKFGLYRVGPASLDVLHTDDTPSKSIDDAQHAIARIAESLATAKMPPPTVIGHRVVHGGPTLRRHCIIDDKVLEQLQAATAFAPLHIPPALSVIRFAQDHFRGLPQVACFDTVFHSTMPEVARTLPIPKELRSQGIERYGFHGLSCESIVRQLGRDLPERLVIAHLGNGASVTAVKNGKSIDTSMGLTPTGGVIMGTRSGDLDPGILVYLAREKGFDAARLEDLVDHRSGLLGLSDLDSDMRRLRQATPSNANARLAIDMFCLSVRKQIAAMVGVLEGVDGIVFTGGIGENDAEARTEICRGLSWADIEGRVRVVPSQEDEQIARHARDLTVTRSSIGLR
jgi:acetate kinase